MDSVKVKKLIPFLAAIMFINFALPIAAAAESLDSLKEKETQATEAGAVINSEINTALNDVNAKYAEIEKLKTDISKAEETLKTSQAEIEVTETNITRRKEAVGKRMKDIQLNGDQRTLEALLDAESLTDFFNRAYAMTVLQNFEREKIESLTSEKEKLATLQETVKTTQESLQENESKLQTEADAMDTKVAELKVTLADNQELLAQISTDKLKEQERITNEKAAEEAKKQKESEAAAAAKKQAEVESSTQKASSSQQSESSETSTESSSTESSTTEEPATPETPNTGGETTGGSGTGQVLYMESTAYSWREAGASNLTATGIDLSKQSNVIAVDPSVIKLGSLVKVDGYGFAVAGDTGGAIKGNIIDVHFDTTAQCLVWGRRHNVRVEIQ